MYLPVAGVMSATSKRGLEQCPPAPPPAVGGFTGDSGAKETVSQDKREPGSHMADPHPASPHADMGWTPQKSRVFSEPLRFGALPVTWLGLT